MLKFIINQYWGVGQLHDKLKRGEAMNCEFCNTECPFVIETQCPLKTLAERAEQPEQKAKELRLAIWKQSQEVR